MSTLSDYLAWLHSRGDWSDAPAYERRLREAKREQKMSRARAHALGLDRTAPLSRNERNLLNGVARWDRARDLK